MCVIAYKKEGAAYPEDKVLETCFTNNPDGAGFMIAARGTVNIVKGLMTFEDFLSALAKARKQYGDSAACVMHFRISTQAGNKPSVTHPYPLSGHMKDLRKLVTRCEVGVAHNGIISATSDLSDTHNDSMLFIQRYLSRLLAGHELDWYKDPWFLEMITMLTSGSRLAILDKTGACTLTGTGWVAGGDIMYSNSSYKPYVYSYMDSGSLYDDYTDHYFGRWDGAGTRNTKAAAPVDAPVFDEFDVYRAKGAGAVLLDMKYGDLVCGNTMQELADSVAKYAHGDVTMALASVSPGKDAPYMAYSGAAYTMAVWAED